MPVNVYQTAVETGIDVRGTQLQSDSIPIEQLAPPALVLIKYASNLCASLSHLQLACVQSVSVAPAYPC